MIFQRLIQGDCLDVLPTLEDESVDLVLTDPPYNIASETKIHVNRASNGKSVVLTTQEAWGNSFNDSFTDEEYLNLMKSISIEFNRVLKSNGSVLIFFDRGKPYYLKSFYDLFHFRNMLCFVKKNPTNHIRKNNYRSSFELCAWFSKEKYHINFISQSKMKNVFHGLIGSVSKEERGWLPTQKYIWMIKPLIERHSKSNDVILDCFLGSGTTMKVARDLGRSCIGIEISPEYCEIARKRVFHRTLDNSITYSFEVFGEEKQVEIVN